MAWYCGWDGGGTTTDICLTDRHGNVLAQRAFGPLNPNGTSRETVEKTVHDCLGFLASQADGLAGCEGLVVGTAGISNLEAPRFLEKTIRRYGYDGPLRIVGDHEIALAGAICGPGAILIAGTGSICFGRDVHEKTWRCGGYGHLIDDEGSGYALGRDILAAVVHSLDGRGPSTCLTDAVFQQLRFDDLKQLITWLYAPETGKKDVAALAPLLQPALAQSDPAAQRIVFTAAQELTRLVTGVWAKAQLTQGEIAMTGSILLHFDRLREQTADLLSQALPQATIVSPRHSAAWGAADMSRHLFH